jgi:hypothetical protein
MKIIEDALDNSLKTIAGLVPNIKELNKYEKNNEQANDYTELKSSYFIMEPTEKMAPGLQGFSGAII